MKQTVIQSSSERTSAIKSLLILDKAQILSSITISFVMLLFLNIPNIWNNITGASSGRVASSYFRELMGQYAPWLYSTYNNIIDGRAFQIFLWLMAGCAAYLLIWFFGSLVTNLRNDFVADSYQHPKFYNRTAFWLSVVSRKVVFTFLAVMVIVYIPIAIGFLIQLAGICFESIMQFQAYNSIVNISASLLTGAVVVQLFFILARLVLNSWKIIYKDL